MRPEANPTAEETLDRLAGDWWIFQLRRGHRYATDDVLTAWSALQTRPAATRVLDLGAGVGAVGLLTLLQLGPAARLTSIEVQQVSVALLLKTLAFNGLTDRVDVRHGDLRRPEILPAGASFDLVIANPPYLPPGCALRSPHPQRAAARLELHGSVFDYCRAATRYLLPEGRFCFCHSANDPRPEQAVAEAGLSLLSRQDVIFSAGRRPTIALFICGWWGARDDPPPMRVRDASGERTAAYRAVRRALWIDA